MSSLTAPRVTKERHHFTTSNCCSFKVSSWEAKIAEQEGLECCGVTASPVSPHRAKVTLRILRPFPALSQRRVRLQPEAAAASSEDKDGDKIAGKESPARP